MQPSTPLAYAPIHQAALEGDTARVLHLIHRNLASIDQKDEEGSSLLHWVAHGGDTQTLWAMASYHYHFNPQNHAGDTALMLATQQGHLSMVKALITLGANVNLYNRFGYTALHWAAATGELAILQELLATPGIMTNFKTDHGHSPIDIAARFERQSIVDYLQGLNRATKEQMALESITRQMEHFSATLLAPKKRL